MFWTWLGFEKYKNNFLVPLIIKGRFQIFFSGNAMTSNQDSFEKFWNDKQKQNRNHSKMKITAEYISFFSGEKFFSVIFEWRLYWQHRSRLFQFRESCLEIDSDRREPIESSDCERIRYFLIYDNREKSSFIRKIDMERGRMSEECRVAICHFSQIKEDFFPLERTDFRVHFCECEFCVRIISLTFESDNVDFSVEMMRKIERGRHRREERIKNEELRGFHIIPEGAKRISGIHPLK